MTNKEVTDTALIEALSQNIPLTDEQRSVLLTIIMQFGRLDADSDRFRFLKTHWRSLMEGIPLHRWIDEEALRRGGIGGALDYAMTFHHSSERHIEDALA